LVLPVAWHRKQGQTAAMNTPVVSRSPDVMGGTVVFHGTRVPVQTLLDYLEAGESINDFLEGFPSVTREQVIAFLEDAKERAIAAIP
jgi:uncharacterized protein (DUF433 family)